MSPRDGSLSSGGPKARMREAFKDANFHRKSKKLTGEDPGPRLAEEMKRRSGKILREERRVSRVRQV